MKNPLLMMGMLALVALLAASCEEKEDPYSGGEEGRPGKNTGVSRPGPGAVPPTPAPSPEPQVDTVESLADEFGIQLEQMGRAMQTVTDEASARKAAEIINLVSAEFRAIVGRLQKLPVPPDQVKEDINAQMEARQAKMEESLGNQEEFMNNLPDEARPIVEEAIATFGDTMTELHPVMAEYFEVSEESEEAPPPEPLEPAPDSPGAPE